MFSWSTTSLVAWKSCVYALCNATGLFVNWKYCSNYRLHITCIIKHAACTFQHTVSMQDCWWSYRIWICSIGYENRMENWNSIVPRILASRQFLMVCQGFGAGSIYWFILKLLFHYTDYSNSLLAVWQIMIRECGEEGWNDTGTLPNVFPCNSIVHLEALSIPL